MAKRRGRARRSRAPTRLLRPAKMDERLSHVRAWLEAREENPDVDRVHLVNTAMFHGFEIWPDDADVMAEHAVDMERMARYRAAFD